MNFNKAIQQQALSVLSGQGLLLYGWVLSVDNKSQNAAIPVFWEKYKTNRALAQTKNAPADSRSVDILHDQGST